MMKADEKDGPVLEDIDKKGRLSRGYVLLYRTAKEWAGRFIDLAHELEDDYPFPERLLADVVDLTLDAQRQLKRSIDDN